MIIREANRKDLFSIAKVQVDSNRSTYKGIIPEEYLNSLSYESKEKYWDERLFSENSKEFMYVAEASDAGIVGFASASLVRTHDLFERELYKIYILKEFQRKGIGKLLIKAVIRKFAEDNVKSVILWTLKDNPSRLFYEHLGGKIAGKRTIQRGGKDLLQIAYGWEDVTCLLLSG